MGMDRTVRFPGRVVPPWEAIRDCLARLGAIPPIRMIDGLPAFPDEVPGVGWRELRLGTQHGMVSIRAGSEALTCVVWGNASAELCAQWDAICWACAAAGSGEVATPTGGWVSADAFAKSASLQPA
jgi:hypothetical protein